MCSRYDIYTDNIYIYIGIYLLQIDVNCPIRTILAPAGAASKKKAPLEPSEKTGARVAAAHPQKVF